MKLLENYVSVIKELIEKGELEKDSPIIAECKDILIDIYYKNSQLEYILDKSKNSIAKTAITLDINKYFADELGFEV